MKKENALLRKNNVSLCLQVKALAKKVDGQAVAKQKHAMDMFQMKMWDNATHLSIQMSKTEAEKIRKLAKLDEQK